MESNPAELLQGQLPAANHVVHHRQPFEAHQAQHPTLTTHSENPFVCNSFCSEDFFGDAKSKRFGLYVVVPEGYQCAHTFCATRKQYSSLVRRPRYSLEKFGKFYLMLEAGMHILVPFVDKITFTRCLKAGLLDCPPQVRVLKMLKLMSAA